MRISKKLLGIPGENWKIWHRWKSKVPVMYTTAGTFNDALLLFLWWDLFIVVNRKNNIVQMEVLLTFKIFVITQPELMRNPQGQSNSHSFTARVTDTKRKSS